MEKIASNASDITAHIMEHLLPDLKQIALDAGEKIMSIYNSAEIEFSEKEDKSPVSIADIEAHKHIVSKLSILTEYPIVSEEDSSSFEKRNSQDWFWLIDPLDGTKEFLNKNGEFTVNIALIGEGASHFGLVYAPAIDLMYWGGKAIGSYQTQGQAAQQIFVNKNSAPPYKVVASKNHLNDQTKSFIAQFKSVDLIQSGSSLKFCRIAEGKADIYPRLAPTCEWDTAAAQAVLEGAGGVVVDLKQNPLRYGKPDILNASFVAASDVSIIPK